LTGLDGIVVSAYLAGIVAMSFLFARRQRTGDDYFLAGRRMGSVPLAMSILGNQASAVSLVGAPAFVALRAGGGLRWLQYELALPLAMLLLIALLLPAIRSVPGSSIYVFAEQRFDRRTRRALAGAFLLSRGLSLGVILYASSLVVAQALAWPVDAALLAIGLFSVAYTSLGGIVADIWSDVIQLVLLWGGTLVSAWYVFDHAGVAVLDAIPADRTRTLVTDSLGVAGGDGFALWPMLFGGIFLYLAYYGCDQSQAQRLLAARSEGEARRALVLNGLLRFPLVLTYCVFGLLLAGLLQVDAGFASIMADKPPDALVPAFMMGYLPSGLRGLLLAAILAAAMSSIDSALNSLAAVTLEDVLDRPSATQSVWTSRGTSLLWGLFAIASGMLFSRSGTHVLELINQVGSVFYGPVLGVFMLGALTRSVDGRAALRGLTAGLAVNVLLAQGAPGVSWLWWNPAGFLTTAVVALAPVGWRAARGPHGRWGAWGPDAWRRAFGPGVWPRRDGVLLGGAFVVMLITLAALPVALGFLGKGDG
jgi:SSS family solute:Na+ symporter